MSYIPNLKYKTTICQNWNQCKYGCMKDKQCYKGLYCYFAHGEQQLRTIQQNKQAISEQNKYLQSMNDQIQMPSNYKTIQCKFYPKGKCHLGDNCTFVHEKWQKRAKEEYVGQKTWTNQFQGYSFSYIPEKQIPFTYLQTVQSLQDVPNLNKQEEVQAQQQSLPGTHQIQQKQGS